MAHRIIGIDVGNESIKIAKLIPSGKNFEIEKTLKIKREGDYIEQLKPLFEQEKNSFFVMGTTEIKLFKRDIELPFTDKSKVLKVLPFQIEQKLPLKLDQIHYDYSMIKNKVEKKTTINTFIVRKDEFEREFEKIKDLDIKLRAYLPDTLAYRYLYNTLDEENTVAFLDIGARYTRFVVFSEDRIITDLTLKIGGNDIDEMIAKTFDVDIDMAKTAKEKVARIFEEETNQDESTLIIEKIIKEKIDKILELIDIELKRIDFNSDLNLYLLGGGANIENISFYLENKYNFNVVKKNNWSSALYAKSVGYALRETPYIRDCKVNFLKGEYVLKSSETGFIPKDAWIYMLYLIVIIALFFAQQKLKYDSLQAKIDKIEDNTAKISKKLINDEFYDPTQLLAVVSDRETGGEKILPSHTALDHLSNISKLFLDANIKLDVKNINIQEKQISITTFVDSIEIIDQLVEALKKDKCYKNIKKGNSKKDRKNNKIRITLTINNMDC